MKPMTLSRRYIHWGYCKCTHTDTDDQVSEEIPTLGGLRQGYPISPKSFSATAQGVFECAQLKEKGINVYRERLSDFRFANDVAPTTEYIEDMNITKTP